MTKQEDIHKGLVVLFEQEGVADGVCVYLKTEARLRAELATKVCEYLHSQSVAIKVEGELPENPFPEEFRNGRAYGRARDWQDGFDAGYTAWELLVMPDGDFGK